MLKTEWIHQYKKKLCTAEEAARAVRDDDFIMTPLCLGQPSTLIPDAIADRKDELKGVEWRWNLAIRPYKILKPEYRGAFKITSAFTGTPFILSQFQGMGYGAYAPATVFSSIKQWTYFRKPDVIVAMVTPPDKDGFVNIGPDLMFSRALLEGKATSQGFVGGPRVLIGEVNDQYIPVCGDSKLHISRFTHIVEHSSPLPAFPPPNPTEKHKKMAEFVVSLLRDKDSIQIGIGAVPMLISDLISHSDLKDIGLFTEMLPTGAPLWLEKGILTGKYKTFRPGEISASFIGPVKDLYDFVRDNEKIGFYAGDVMNNPAVIGAEERMVGINGALEIDLAGQVASLTIGNKMVSGYGGQSDFAMGCRMSRFGRMIIVMSAATRDAQGNLVSRIVPNLSPGALVGTLAVHVDYVVTEFGIAGPLDGLSIDERAEALIGVAHPDLQEELMRGAKEKGLFK
ncbi:MAG TPA: acetyl-CoA hydrolase/transferase C-terminal domain-containing protein [Syntrophales bacterium]|nr:acetyl-CoA hydrolase/transferase C-terminal domain-containing protein [Syntrophales bacterium]HOM07545.1 acetyl-CoA hydrolase/transferase C-terminal domain-containing protein [Syntrophales bacterium]HOO00103.1 acetyl-CoA hydrolase/transferase C-terminal domain-containing protein [Syntrophales bacterium]